MKPLNSWALLLCLFLTHFTHAQTSLRQGDLAIIAMDTDNERFAFVCFVELSTGTEIFFSDEEPQDSLLSGGEGRILYTAPQNIAAGTVIRFFQTDSGGFTAVKGNFTLANSGDGIVAFQDYNSSTDVVGKFLYQCGKSSSHLGNAKGLHDAEKRQTGSDNFEYIASRSGSIPALWDRLQESQSYNFSNSALGLFDSQSFSLSSPLLWNGSQWSGGNTPQSGDAVLINSNQAPGSFQCTDLLIAENTSLTLDSADNVQIYGSILNRGNGIKGKGNLHFNAASPRLYGEILPCTADLLLSDSTRLYSNGKLALKAESAETYGTLRGGIAVEGSLSAECYLDLADSTYNLRYYFLGSPFQYCPFSDFAEGGVIDVSGGSEANVWEWDAANAQWEAPANGRSSDTVVNGRGYAFYCGTNGQQNALRAEAGPIALRGTYDLSNRNITLSYHNGQASTASFSGGSSINATQGWNLIANPFLAPYDWDQQSIPAGMNSAIYTWDGENFRTYLKGGGNGDRFIAPFQAFWVQLNTNTSLQLPMQPSHTATQDGVPLYKQPGASLWGLRLCNTTGELCDEVFFGFQPGSSQHFDPAWDALKLKNAAHVPNLYIQDATEQYAIYRIPPPESHTFSLGLEHQKEGEEFTLSLMEDALIKGESILLEDLLSGRLIDLRTSPYNFQYREYNGSRFRLHYNAPLSIAEDASVQPWVYVEEGICYIKGTGSDNYTINLCDSRGRSLTEKMPARGDSQISLANAPGLYLLRLEQGGKHYTFKLLKAF